MPGLSPARTVSGAGPVLVLGGTAEARALARVLVDGGVPVVSSLAGRTSDPELPAGEVRTGGFGGADGLAAYVVHPEHVAAGAVIKRHAVGRVATDFSV